MRNFTNQYFTKKERRSLFLLASLVFIGTVTMYLVYHFDKPEQYMMADLMDHALKDSIDQATQNEDHNRDFKKSSLAKTRKVQFGKFDPNVISADELMAMGVSRYASSNLEKYRKKGGKIKSKQQFFKIYGMEKYIAMLDSLIRINENQNPENANNSMSGTSHTYPTSKDTSTVREKKDNRATPIPTVKLKVIELNGADSFELESIRGIGAFLAARIIKYRNKLGGFYEIGQLEEVYGMRPQTFMEINHLVKANADLILKMKINSVDEKTLAAHPYIGRKAASILLRYKKQHGNFKSIEDFMKVRIYDDEEIQRLKWYIDFAE